MNCLAVENRRLFLQTVGKAAVAGAACALARRPIFAEPQGAEVPLPPVVVFGKFFQELRLDFDQSARVTAAAGLAGVDCAVRPGGEIAPERAADEMPKYAAALRKRGVKMLSLTTGILGVDSPHARNIVTTGKKLGIDSYRLGFWSHHPDVAEEKTISRTKERLAKLAAMNRKLGVCAMIQNHSFPRAKAGTKPGRGQGGGIVGGDLDELHDIVKDFDPAQVAIAFDLGHAIIMHGDGWHRHFEQLKRYIRAVYIKDVNRAGHFVRFGTGVFGQTDYFTRLKRMNYRRPLCIHIEYAWAPGGKKTRPAMIETLTTSRQTLSGWWQHG